MAKRANATGFFSSATALPLVSAAGAVASANFRPLSAARHDAFEKDGESERQFGLVRMAAVDLVRDFLFGWSCLESELSLNWLMLADPLQAWPNRKDNDAT